MQNIVGYQLNGIVMTSNGIPLDSVMVRLFYRYDYVRSTPLDTVQIYLPALGYEINVSVWRDSTQYIRTLYSGTWSTGYLPRFRWDGKDTNLIQMPSGKYFIRCIINNRIIKETPVVLDGSITAITNNNGRFTITDTNLPIGEQFDIYRSNGTFYGVYRVSSTVALEFHIQEVYAEYPTVDLQKNQVTNLAFTL
ncbi:MAG: hypothetical protein QME52_06875 [Bacteroidota bacterium]|nr:hypothetical protein [Bacteroidota bacterium]